MKLVTQTSICVEHNLSQGAEFQLQLGLPGRIQTLGTALGLLSYPTSLKAR